jgi:secondary thiamine-phosphate synthase enzyme
MLTMARHSLSVSTRIRRQVVDLTRPVQERVARTDVADGLVVVNTLHTTCCLLVNELQEALVDDLTALMQRLVAEDGGYRHDDPRYSDCERGNGSAHLRAGLLGQSVVVGLSARELCLGRFQSILFVEWDGPRTRTIDVQIMGA